jgi:hypothetical protein
MATITPHQDQTVAGMLGTVLQQLLNGSNTAASNTKANSAVSQHGTMQNIKHWYATTFPAFADASAGKQPQGTRDGGGGDAGGGGPPILIMLEEIERYKLSQGCCLSFICSRRFR